MSISHLVGVLWFHFERNSVSASVAEVFVMVIRIQTIGWGAWILVLVILALVFLAVLFVTPAV